MITSQDYDVDANGCWIWLGAIYTHTGYGRIGNGYAHRRSYEQHVGPIPFKFQVDHLCRVRRCINPEHLEAVTQYENLLREHAAVTHCPVGHEYTPENTYVAASGLGGRRCRACGRDMNRKRAVARREQRHAAGLMKFAGHAVVRSDTGWVCKCGQALAATKAAARVAMTGHRADLVRGAA